MSRRGHCDVLIVHGCDALTWCQYLKELFRTSYELQNLHTESYEINEDPIEQEDFITFRSSKCIVTLLSEDLAESFNNQIVLADLQRVLTPANKILVLYCGVTDYEDFSCFFKDWTQWKKLSSDDDSDLYIEAVKEKIWHDHKKCENISFTSSWNADRKDIRQKQKVTDSEDDKAKRTSAPHVEKLQPTSLPENHRNLICVQPERIHCGDKTQIYLIFKCKLDCQVKNEVYFNPQNGQSVRVHATLQNEYILTVEAPDLPAGLVFLNVFSGDLQICEAKISYYTDMEELSYLLQNATNPVEFMCQAFKIVPYSIEALDKLLTESLKNNIPASGLHLFGINQIEEENLSANHRDEELPTLLHFSAKYGLKNLTALLLTCPGALQAYSVSNKSGDYPNNIAEKYGFKDLRQFIDEYVETADMLRTHIKEELMNEEDVDDCTYESMANISTDLLMKCSLNPGCDDDLYESMAGMGLPTEEEIYVDMQTKGAQLASSEHIITAKDSVIRKILEGGNLDITNEAEDSHHHPQDDLYDTVEEDTSCNESAYRPPLPVPRTNQPPETKRYSSQVFKEKTQTRSENIYVSQHRMVKGASVKIKRDRSQSSVYDPFVGMKTPGQRELITLQEQVKCGMISVDEALQQFKEWQLNQKRRSDSFRFQQENLKKLRDSINRRKNEHKKKKAKDLKITEPIRRGKNTETNTIQYNTIQYGIYNPGPMLHAPPKRDITRGNWKNDSTSSTASSGSNRSSTRSIMSTSSGMEGDSEDNEYVETFPRHSSMQPVKEENPPARPPKIPNRRPIPTPPATKTHPPPVPPRGR
ncbi:phosphoinositide 3-kinase adapter protein 1 isoform X2 [Xenopus laevis]|uniref:Phosphoinositide 3-kinase adapter protein 1 isoform X2 n=1 Tax=Xenopus laevis TaxID=8355 RepID=A0A8J0U718_XENLA|nr:phosphoinositide 3-kinase adapter protein 1 isoform X2 [Xenopus laevis]